MDNPRDRVPAASLIFGYGAMVPLVLAAVGAWGLPRAWPVTAVRLAVIWGALVLAFVGGVRRGGGFMAPGTPPNAGLGAAVAYFALAGLALVATPYDWIALPPLVAGFALCALLDRAAARRGAVPPHFAALRPPQMLLGAAALLAMWLRVMF